MFTDMKIERLPKQDWIGPIRLPNCRPWCPSDGHTVRVETPGNYRAEQHAEGRVRALHDVLVLRRLTHALSAPSGGLPNIPRLLGRLAWFASSVQEASVDYGTWDQIGNIRSQMVQSVARKVTSLLQSAKNEGFLAGAEFVLQLDLGEEKVYENGVIEGIRLSREE